MERDREQADWKREWINKKLEQEMEQTWNKNIGQILDRRNININCWYIWVTWQFIIYIDITSDKTKTEIQYASNCVSN